MTTQDYVSSISQRYQAGNTTEHSFRGDLQNLIESLVPEVSATNEPKRQACGAPDYILMKNGIDVGFIEAKDIGDKDLEGKKKSGNKEQFDRYKASLHNLIFTDYLDFHVYREGEFITKIAIAKLTEKGIEAIPAAFEDFEKLFVDFCGQIFQSITSPQKLAQMMAGKARLLADIIGKALTYDIENEEDSTLQDQFTAFKNILIHDITPQGFADVYAQTIAYGMFAARLHDPTLETFSREEAARLIPKSNPFLRKLFQYIAGYDLDDRIKWVVDDLVQIFLACNVKEILKDYGKATKMEDPIIHFYETFLAEYDPKLRKARGVWYTPAPVVNFIVRAVDDVLKTEFGLSSGLANTSKTKIKVETQSKKKPQEVEVHKVQILDPATGTGTFLAEVIKHIHRKNFKAAQGAWSGYVENHLLPRLNGFELLMASYAMAHLQLDLLLEETGYTPTDQKAKDQRLNVYLTNSLEAEHPDAGTLFASWLSTEANEASRIKRDTPVMCILGNPPYSGESANKGQWIMNLMEDYKKEPGGKEKLSERNPKWLNDDYVKFMRYGQHFIEKNGSGVLAFINPHGFLDNPTFRGMRWSLLKTYDKIYTIDLHGNSKKKETAPDGSVDQNVFDIQQGVSINILVKTGKKKANALGKVFHYDLYGKREVKYDFLRENSLKSVAFQELPNTAPNYYMQPKDFGLQENYHKGFEINALFPLNNVGIVTSRDAFVIDENVEALARRMNDFFELSKFELQGKYGLKENKRWKIEDTKWRAKFFNPKAVTPIAYRPFDKRYLYYEGNFVERSRIEVMQHFLTGENVGLAFSRQSTDEDWTNIQITDAMIDNRYHFSYKGIPYQAPLYLYPQVKKKKTLFGESKAQRKKTLEDQLVQAKKHYAQIKSFFNKTVLPFYEQIENPDENSTKLFEENRSTYEEAKANVELLNQQLKALDAPQLALEEEEETKTSERVPNLDAKIVEKIAKKLKLIYSPNPKNIFESGKDVLLKAHQKYPNNSFVPKKNHSIIFPIDILDYIYAVLHSPSYREKYKEFLKIDFPRVPYPDKNTFWDLVKLGGEIRQIHLLEGPKVEKFITSYPIDGNNEITRKLNKKDWELTDENTGRIWLNDTQYFDNIPLVAWEFYIGGYQPAQKWLKDRRGRTLDFEDIEHYQKIIVALTETDRLMKEIDEVLEV